MHAFKGNTLLFSLEKNCPFCILAAAGTPSSLWCSNLSHCSNLPSSEAPLHRVVLHNAQMVAIVLLPCPLPHSVEQEALLCMPEGQETWLTNAEPSEKHKNTHKNTFMFTHFSYTKAKNLLYYYAIYGHRIKYYTVNCTPIVYMDVILTLSSLCHQCCRHEFWLYYLTQILPHKMSCNGMLLNNQTKKSPVKRLWFSVAFMELQEKLIFY